MEALYLNKFWLTMLFLLEWANAHWTEVIFENGFLSLDFLKLKIEANITSRKRDENTNEMRTKKKKEKKSNTPRNGLIWNVYFVYMKNQTSTFFLFVRLDGNRLL